MGDHAAESDRKSESDTRPVVARTESPDAAKVTTATPNEPLSIGRRQIQAKTVVGASTDPAEKEAEATADKVMQTAAGGTDAAGPGLQSSSGPHVAEQIRRAGGAKSVESASDQPDVAPAVERYLDSTAGAGKPLSPVARNYFDTRFNADFSTVRIHDDAGADHAARAIDALAFTRGTDIYFRAGTYDPGSDRGKRLIAHELTHVAQRADTQETPVRRVNAIQRDSVIRRLSWIDQRILWVRDAIDHDNWSSTDENAPGAYYLLNGYSMDDMVRVLRACTTAQRKKFERDLNDFGASFDRSRLQLAVHNAAGGGDAVFREKSETLLWAIRSGNLGGDDGAFSLLYMESAALRKRLLKALNRDALDVLEANKDLAGDNADRLVTEILAARAEAGHTASEQKLIDLMEAKMWKEFFRAFNGMNESAQMRFLRATRSGAQIVSHLDEAAGISDQNQIRHLIERAELSESTSLYVDAFARHAKWRPHYKVKEGEPFGNTIEFGDIFNAEIDIGRISESAVSTVEAQRQVDEAKVGEGGLLWPASINRSTVPGLWKKKQLVREQQNILLYDEVLKAGIETVVYVMTTLVPEAMSMMKLSLTALERSVVSGRWMKGSQVIRSTTGAGAEVVGRGIWDLPTTIARGRAAEDVLKAVLPGEKFYGNFARLDRALYGAGGAAADAVEVGQLKSYDAVKSYAKGNAFYNRVMKDAGELGGIGESTWKGGGKSVTIGKDTRRVLDVAIPDEILPVGKNAQLTRAIEDAKTIGVEIRVHRIR